jgi:hypothetical protein
MMSGAANVEAQVDYRRRLLAALYFVAAFYGAGLALSKNVIAYSCIAILIATLATAWCIADARRQGKPLLPALQMIMFFTWPVAGPVYLIASRELRGLLYAVVHTICLYALIIVSFLFVRRMYFGIPIFSR